MFKLVKYSSNWADEMDVDGFRTMTDTELEEWKKNWQEVFKEDGEFTFYIGTNEDIPYEDYDTLLADFTFEDITKEEYDILNKLFPACWLYGQGFFPG